MNCVRKIKFNSGEALEIEKELDGYIWIAVDVKRGMIAGGDERITNLKWELLRQKCNIYNIFGIGLDLVTGEIDYYSEINIKRVERGSTKEVPMEKRERIETLVAYFFEDFSAIKNCNQGRYVKYKKVLYNREKDKEVL
ncbi:MAG: DUF5674 family protein [Candidatus Nomurabacteria bacterium]|jgi:hypothetical protein|nr:DUF5674 family protein [Candidatus Nomurabacteria bacterium]